MDSNKVRYSRDGDQFHYLWAARRCLKLLSSTSGLVAISIEGSSGKETLPEDSIEAGEEIIDVGEYYGSEDINNATRIRYIQLKHSTQNASKAWVPSGLKNTLEKFSIRYKAFKERFSVENPIGRIEFIFVSNRLINNDFMEAIKDSSSKVKNQHPKDLDKLESYTALRGDDLSSFCQLLKLEGGQDNYWFQRENLAQETKAYLPGDDVNAPVQLKELVTRKALSESIENPSIRKTDVLRAMGTTEDRLFPAPSRLEIPRDAIPRCQEHDIFSKIISANAPVIIHAAGGVGKSILSQRIHNCFPENSITVVYDCFGNGEYRRNGSPRHRHKDALVQIVNELATQGVCDPLIPSSNADNTDYLKAFIHRLKQSIDFIKSQNQQSILCIVIDAADNAEMAAKELGDSHAFTYDLLREPLPDDLRLVFLCRTERQEILEPISTVLRLELESFNRNETAALLRQKYPDASENDVDEFHRLTSNNPRVQAFALAQTEPLSIILRSLGPNPTTVNDTINTLLKKAIDNLRDQAGSAEQCQLDMICTCLAVLRPLIPLNVLASISNVHQSTISSFAADLGYSLLITGDTIQFRDEPTETWFREHFSPESERLSTFIDTLQTLSSENAYVASTLPQMMLEAGQLKELIELALTSSSLPTNNPIEKRDIEIQRLQFALKASLRENRYVDAAKLALKAGVEMAGNTRQLSILKYNTDLAATFLDSVKIHEIVSRRTFDGGWIGSHYAYEASLLSYIKDFKGEACSRLRMTYEWLSNWSRLTPEEQQKEKVNDNEILEISITQFNISGPQACAEELRRWLPREVSFRVGRLIARRFVDHGNFNDLNMLSLAAGNDLCLLLSINLELRAVHKFPPKQTVERALRLILNKRIKISIHDLSLKETTLQTITALVESAHVYQLQDNDVLATVLQRYLPDSPPHGLSSRYVEYRHPILHAYSLYSVLKCVDLQIIDLAPSDIRKHLEDDKNHNDSREVREFREIIGILLPWYKLRAANIISKMTQSDIKAKVCELQRNSDTAVKLIYREPDFTLDEIAEIWLDILVFDGESNDPEIQEFQKWAFELQHPLLARTWIKLTRLVSCVPKFNKFAYEFANRAFELTKNDKLEAEFKSQIYVDLARAILNADKSEAIEYFNQAIEVSAKLGDEIYDRWLAMLDLADQSSNTNRPAPKTAYRFSRCAEVVKEYEYDHFDWKRTTESIAGLCPSSIITILSRWRDRNFGNSHQLLATAIHYLLDSQCIEPKTATALVGFISPWDYSNLFERALNTCLSQVEREIVMNHILRYMQLSEHSSSVWKEMKAIAEKNKLRVPGIDQIIKSTEIQCVIESSNQENNIPKINSNVYEKDWDSIFQELDLYTSRGLAESYNNFKDTEPPFSNISFFKEIFKRVPNGKETELIRVYSESAVFDLYDFRFFVEQIPTNWKSRLAIKSALAEAIRKNIYRHCMKIIKSRSYEILPLQLATELSGISEKDLIKIALTAIGESTEIMQSGRLFTLVGLLAPQLSQNEALDVLNDGLDSFDECIDEKDGDGPWSADLEPPTDFDEAIAGYIWASLAAPIASLRWESTHVVKGICSLGIQRILNYLFDMSNKSSGKPFVDSRLYFYHRHALQWFLISLARAANEDPSPLLLHKDFFVHHALNNDTHVLNRHFAAQAALFMNRSEKVEFEADLLEQLTNVNKSLLEVVKSKRYDRYNYRSHTNLTSSRTKRFRFGFDMDKYWFEGLGDCFALSTSTIEKELEDVIFDDWQLCEDGSWKNDARYNRKIFRENDTSYSHGVNPNVENLQFYLSYHALMTVVGNLLKKYPLHQDPDSPYDNIANWLNKFLLTRNDGYWLADGRNPIPFECKIRNDGKQDDGWRWSVNKKDFESALGIDKDKLNLWGFWTAVSDRRKETVYIRSALVSPDHSISLLKALQTASNPHDFCIPDADNRLEIDEFGFKLKGWIEDHKTDRGIDEFDPWSGDIQFPPPKPASFIRDLFYLESESDCRVWKIKTEKKNMEMIWSQVWGNLIQQEYASDSNHGDRLQASYAFIKKMLIKTNMDLIVNVEIDRRFCRYRYERYEDEIEFMPPYFKVFVINADSQIFTL